MASWRQRVDTPPETPAAIARTTTRPRVERDRYPTTVALLEWWARPYSSRLRRFLAVRLSIAEGHGIYLPRDTW